MATLRKMPHPPDALPGVRYTPTAVEEDPEDNYSDSGKLTYIMSHGGQVPLNGDVGHHNKALTASTTATPVPVNSIPNIANYPYYDFQDTDNESDAGGCDSGEPSSPGRLPNGKPLISEHSTYNTQPRVQHHTYHNPNHNSSLSEKISVDSTGRHLPHSELGDSRDLREFSKSPLSRTSRAGGKGRCMCCMMCIFLLSTAGLGAVLALAYAGEVQLGLAPPVHKPHSNGGFQVDRLGDEKVVVQSCETRDCIETAAAILSRMNTSAEPCHDFYNYACGGYHEKTYLSWFRTRVRETPEEIIDHYRQFAIDRLSSSYAKKDSHSLTRARTLFRSCLFRPQSVDERTRVIVSEVIDSVGGLSMPEAGSAGKLDLTPLVANVTRLYGASPFFRIRVHGPKRVSISTRLADYTSPIQSPSGVLSRSVDPHPGQSVLESDEATEKLLLSLLARTNYTGDLGALVREYLRLEANIRRTFNGDSQDDMDDSCDEFTRSSFSELQFRHGSYGINWTDLVLTVLDLPTARDVIICDVQLSRPLQHLLEITPQPVLWQFTILHTLLHSDLFLIVSGHSAILTDLPSGVTKMTAPASTLETEELRTRSPENQCLDLLEYVMPDLKSSIHCETNGLKTTAKETGFLLEQLRTALFGILKDMFRISSENSWKITNTTVNLVRNEVLLFLKSLEADHDTVHVDLDEYDFSGNVLELLKFRNQQYYGGKMRLHGYTDDLTAFGIRACFEDTSLGRPGPQLYHAAVPHAVRFGSLGTFLAGKIADNLGLEDLLDHYSEGVLNHSAVLGLAVRLQCFVHMYNNIKLIDYGTQVYKVNGEENRVRLWKDQLALQMIMMAWRTYHNGMTDDKELPGLALSRDQLFYVAFAQTQCEKVSERGILQHYVNQDFQMPNKHRVNGPLTNLHDFYRSFHCGMSKDVCDLF